MQLVKILLFLACFAGNAHAVDFDYSAFAQVPIQNDGRVKPLDTFARTNLLLVYGKRSLPELSAMGWLTELLFTPQLAYQRKVFNLPNPDLVSLLGLERRQGNKYSFAELFESLRAQNDNITKLAQKEKGERTPAQNQLLELQGKAGRYFEISRSLIMLTPTFGVRSEKTAAELNLHTGQSYNYMELSRIREAVRKRVDGFHGKKFADMSEDQRDYAGLAFQFQTIEEFGIPDIFRVVPPQWDGQERNLWLSPGMLVQTGGGSPRSAQYFEQWRALSLAFMSGDIARWNKAALELSGVAATLAVRHVRAYALPVEMFYNHWELYYKAIAFYLAAFLCLLASWMFWPETLRRVGFGLLACGVAFHLVGVGSRMFIMGRPPVSTLYESIIFVALVALIFSLILEKVSKNGLGLLIGSVAGPVLLFISFGYADEGDTMGMLVAVLNTNFWLATHVVCITIGYGCCLVGGVIGHAYLVMRLLRPNASRLGELHKNMLGVSMVALFFAMFGTILGGIWADQSWGRFWGWDPKENGAMLIVLWLLFLLHGRLAGVIKPLGYGVGMVFTNVIVALAWFGVNLLNVGLHSYGFTENIATNLATFCITEAIFALVMYHFITIKDAGRSAAAKA